MKYSIIAFLLFLSACATTKQHAELIKNSPYEISTAKIDAFPAQDFLSVGGVQQFSEELSIRTEADDVDTLNLSYERSVQVQEESKVQVTYNLLEVQKQVEKDQSKSQIKVDSLKKLNPLVFEVNCQQAVSVDEKQLAALNIKLKTVTRKEQEPVLVSALANIVSHLPGVCSLQHATFSLKEVVSKKPGYSWKEKFPFENYGDAQVQMTFLGWHKKGEQWYAVLHSQAQGQSSVSDSLPTQNQIQHSGYLLVSQDWNSVLMQSESQFSDLEQNQMVLKKKINQSSKSVKK